VTTHPLPPLPGAFTFGAALIKAREVKGFTQRQLADASGVSLSAIKAYESGRNLPGARELREICQAVEVSPNRMLFGVEQPFSDRTTLDVLLQATSTPLDEHLLPLRLGTLAALLAPEERDSLLTLATSLAVARHGDEAVRAALRQTDGVAVMTRSLMKATAEAHQSGTPIDVPEAIKEIERSLETLGGAPNRLPKK
jgi:transcriptional regulator with XRE-family HTH domain